jgi:hypothetical protein
MTNYLPRCMSLIMALSVGFLMSAVRSLLGEKRTTCTQFENCRV